MIYHITTELEYQQALALGVYTPANFAGDGFIHFSDHFQVEETANRFYRETPGLILLQVDPNNLDVPLVYENLEGGSMPYPHVYGPLKTSLVREVFAFTRDERGFLRLPEALLMPPPPLFTELPFGQPGRVFRSTMPGSSMFDPDNKVFANYLDENIHTVVVLNTAEELLKYAGSEALARYRQAGLHVVHSPTPDFSAPPKGTWDEALGQVEQLVRGGRNVVIHCHAGIGRTGIFSACLAQDLLGLSAEDSIRWTRQYIPWAIETHYQEQFVRQYKQ